MRAAMRMYAHAHAPRLRMCLPPFRSSLFLLPPFPFLPNPTSSITRYRISIIVIVIIIALSSIMTTDASATDSAGAGGDCGSNSLAAASSICSRTDDIINDNATMTITMREIGFVYAGGNVLWEGRGPIA